jgi:hypothetical protein
MVYRKFKADNLFTGYEMLDAGWVLVTDGTIQDIVPIADAGKDIEVFHGLFFRFINAIATLSRATEGLFQKKGWWILHMLVAQRHPPEEKIYEAIERAEDEMINGIVCWRVCNNSLTIS